MDIMYTFLVDFARPQRTNELLVMQNDALTRVARFVLMNNGKALDVSDVDAVTINAVLPDESRITAEASLLTDDDDEPLNEIIYAIPASMTSAIGKTVVTISLYSTPANSDPKLLNSFEFYINTRNELNRDDGDDGDDYAGIRDLINRALEAVALVEQLIARSTLPNPYPLEIILEDVTYRYDGSEWVQVDFGNLFSRLRALEEAFPDGCRIIARAITAGRGTYQNPINGVPTSENASPTTMATNIKTLAVNNYNQGVTDTKAIDPTFSTTWSTRTSGTQATYQTKTTNAGWTEVNEVQQTLTSKVTAQINTTGDDQIHDFNVVPDAYHKAKVNQKPAYDAGYDKGYEDGLLDGFAGVAIMCGQGGSDSKTVVVPPGVYKAECFIRGWGNYIAWVTVVDPNLPTTDANYTKFDGRTTPTSDDHQYHSAQFTLTADRTTLTISGEAPNNNSCFACGALYKIADI